MISRARLSLKHIRQLTVTTISFGFLLIGILHTQAMAETLQPSASGQEHTNVIYILVDDLGYGDVGAFGQEKIKTPQLDRLAEQGMRFTPGGIRPGAAGHDVCFIHPKGSADAPEGGRGVLIELVQAPDDLIRAAD